HITYFNQYNASVQYALVKDLLVEAVYVGSHGVNLIRNVRINQASLASPQHPIINQVTIETITTNTPTNVALRAPFQGVEVGNFQQVQSTAQSTYNSVQMSLTKRLSRGLQFLAAYTFAKSIDNAAGGSASTGDTVDGFPGRANQFDNRANRGVSDFDRTHRFVLSYLWDLLRPSFAESSTFSRLLFYNWQVAVIISAMFDLPYDFVTTNTCLFI